MVPIKPEGVTWTDDQWEAIYEDGCNIIVSAGAGSGKTAVLTERVIKKLENGVNVNELLILTFTKAAAAEMAARIRSKIKKNPDLKEQLNLLDSAYITTFDSYALSVVKKYHYLLNKSQNINIIDDSVMQIKKKEIMEELFDELYQSDDELFLKMINSFCMKDDDDIKSHIIIISNKLDMLSNKKEYLENYLEKYYDEDKINKDILAYTNIIKLKLKKIDKELNNISYYDNEYANKIRDSLEGLFSQEDYSGIKEYLNVKIPMVPKNSDSKVKEHKEVIGKIIKEVKELTLYKDLDEIKESINLTYDTTKVIIKIILEFTKRVMAYKEERDVYEFNDIAILAIKVLKDNKEVREEIKRYFKEIMIDEYQDTNDLQEEFIGMIANDNVYMVGDIKQSIYRFRNANPYIFKNKYDSYSTGINGKKIDLVKNFRSRFEVLDDINIIFNLIMDDYLGGANYLESHQMVFGNNTYITKGDNKSNNNLEVYSYLYERDLGFNKEEIEAFIIADDIKKKIESKYLVLDKEDNILRPIEYKDMCIIMDRATSFELYKKIFSYLGIPLTLYKDEKMNDSYDVLVIKNLITLIKKVRDNSFDTEFKYLFISILRSFLFEEDDKKIFEYFKNNDFTNNDLYRKCLELAKKTSYLTTLELLDLVILEFNYYEKLLVMGNIKSAMTRIDKIKQMASNLEGLGYDIDKFIVFLNTLFEEEYELKYSVSEIASDSVKIMTIHKSKGLEYPICYYSGLYKSFNISDLKEKFTYDSAYGIIVPYFKEGIGETIYKDLLREKYLAEEISEKIRLFYVAVTRAREKMIVVMPSSDKELDNSNVSVLDKEVKEGYRNLKDLIDSVEFRIKDKYKNINLREIPLTSNYKNIKLTNYKDNIPSASEELRVSEINVDNKVISSDSFSKKVNKLIDKKEAKMMELGTSIHEILEVLDFKNPNYSIIANEFYKDKIMKFLASDKLKDVDKAKIYKEYEFIYDKDDSTLHGIIDLMLEYDNYIDIIDYKLKNVDDDNYVRQLEGYREYIRMISNKRVNIYLYSILDNKFKEIS